MNYKHQHYSYDRPILGPKFAVATLLAVISLLAFGPASVAGVNCGPYFRNPSLDCTVTCERVNGSDPVAAAEHGPLVFAGSLSCFCGQDLANGGRPTCNVTAPHLFAGGVPEFNVLRDGDWLRSVRVSGITELWNVHREAFLPVSSSLRELELTDNTISLIESGAFSQLHALTLLNLSGNRLGGDWPLQLPSGSDTPRLTTLDLSRNLIRTLELNKFACLTNLRDLRLDANPLLHIGDSATWWRGPVLQLHLPSLRTLSLAYSGGGGVSAGEGGLTALTTCNYVTLCRLLQLERLSLAGTRWSCDCRARWAWLAYYGGDCPAIDAQVDNPRCYPADEQHDDDDGGGGLPLAQVDFTGCPAPPDADELQRLCPLGLAWCPPVVVRPLAEAQTRSLTGLTTPSAAVTVPAVICGDTLVNRARVTSPKFPLSYPSNVHCMWRLLATVDHLVRITFDSFATEKAFDLVTIVNGTLDDPTALRLTYSGVGRYSPLTLGPEVTITFSSDAAVEDRGFQIDFVSVPRHGHRKDDSNVAAEAPQSGFVTGCGANFTGQAVFSSPEFPVLYPNHLRCKWHLRADAGHVVRLDFPMFALENDFDYLEVYDGDVSADRGMSSLRLTGSGLVDPLRFGPVVTVVLSTDYSGQSNGFLARFTSVPRDKVQDAAAMASSSFSGCGGVIIGSGLFTSPGYPVAYPSEANCLWVLRAASPRHFIRLEFTRVAVEQSRDLIKIFDVDGSNKARHFSSFSGVGVRRPHDYGRQVAVAFTADSAVQLQGFQARFTSEVNPNARNATSIIPEVRRRTSFTRSSAAFTSTLPTRPIEATANPDHTSKEPSPAKMVVTVEDTSGASSTTAMATTADGTSAASSIAVTFTPVGSFIASTKTNNINVDGTSTAVLLTKANITSDSPSPVSSTAVTTTIDGPSTASSVAVITSSAIIDCNSTESSTAMSTFANDPLTASLTTVTTTDGGFLTVSSTEVSTTAEGSSTVPSTAVITTAADRSTAPLAVVTTADGSSTALSTEVITTTDGHSTASSTAVTINATHYSSASFTTAIKTSDDPVTMLFTLVTTTADDHASASSAPVTTTAHSPLTASSTDAIATADNPSTASSTAVTTAANDRSIASPAAVTTTHHSTLTASSTEAVRTADALSTASSAAVTTAVSDRLNTSSTAVATASDGPSTASSTTVMKTASDRVSLSPTAVITTAYSLSNASSIEVITTADGPSTASSTAVTSNASDSSTTSSTAVVTNANGSSTASSTEATATSGDPLTVSSKMVATTVHSRSTASSTEVIAVDNGPLTVSSTAVTKTASNRSTKLSTVVTTTADGPSTTTSVAVTMTVDGCASKPSTAVTKTVQIPLTTSLTSASTTANGSSTESSAALPTTADGPLTVSSATVITTADGSSTTFPAAVTTSADVTSTKSQHTVKMTSINSTLAASSMNAVVLTEYITSLALSRIAMATTAASSFTASSPLFHDNTIHGTLDTSSSTLASTAVQGQSFASSPENVTKTVSLSPAETSGDDGTSSASSPTTVTFSEDPWTVFLHATASTEANYTATTSRHLTDIATVDFDLTAMSPTIASTATGNTSAALSPATGITASKRPSNASPLTNVTTIAEDIVTELSNASLAITTEGTSIKLSLTPTATAAVRSLSGSMPIAVTRNAHVTATERSPSSTNVSFDSSLMVQSPTGAFTTAEGTLPTLLPTTATTISESSSRVLLSTLLIMTNIQGQTTASSLATVNTTAKVNLTKQSPITTTTSVGVVPMERYSTLAIADTNSTLTAASRKKVTTKINVTSAELQSTAANVVAKGVLTASVPVKVTQTADSVLTSMSLETGMAIVEEPSSVSSQATATAAANCSRAVLLSTRATANADGTLMALLLKSATTAAPEAFTTSSSSQTTAIIVEGTWKSSSVTQMPEKQGLANPDVTTAGFARELINKVTANNSPRSRMSVASSTASGEHTRTSKLPEHPVPRTAETSTVDRTSTGSSSAWTPTASDASFSHATTQGGVVRELNTLIGASSSSNRSSSSVAVFSKFLTSLARTHRKTGETVSTVIITPDGVRPVTTVDARHPRSTTGATVSGIGCRPSFSIGNLLLVSAFVPPTLQLAIV